MPTSKRAPSVCIIGAGSSGIAAAKVLHRRGRRRARKRGGSLPVEPRAAGLRPQAATT